MRGKARRYRSSKVSAGASVASGAGSAINAASLMAPLRRSRRFITPRLSASVRGVVLVQVLLHLGLELLERDLIARVFLAQHHLGRQLRVVAADQRGLHVARSLAGLLDLVQQPLALAVHEGPVLRVLDLVVRPPGDELAG